jgi:hypothetical protein
VIDNANGGSDLLKLVQERQPYFVEEYVEANGGWSEEFEMCEGCGSNQGPFVKSLVPLCPICAVKDYGYDDGERYGIADAIYCFVDTLSRAGEVPVSVWEAAFMQAAKDFQGSAEPEQAVRDRRRGAEGLSLVD